MKVIQTDERLVREVTERRRAVIIYRVQEEINLIRSRREEIK